MSRMATREQLAAPAEDEVEPSEPPQRLSIDVVVEDETWNDLGDVADWVKSAGRAVDAGIEDCAGTVALALADDASVRRLNQQFRGIDKSTNVLSFPSGDDRASVDQYRNHGDMILARETVVREAAELGIPLAHHVQHLVVHGLLHLFGYDHLTPTEADEMEDLERALLATLGIPDPYADTDPA
jgi:probable rRNA maturation factor